MNPGSLQFDGQRLMNIMNPLLLLPRTPLILFDCSVDVAFFQLKA